MLKATVNREQQVLQYIEIGVQKNQIRAEMQLRANEKNFRVKKNFVTGAEVCGEK